MIPKVQEPYSFDPAFERAVVTLACSNARFFGRIGHELDPELFKFEASKVAMRAARAIYRDAGHGPEAALLVIQRLRRWMSDGKVTLELIKKVADLFDRAEDSGLPSAESIIAELTPEIQRRIRDEAVKTAIDAFGKNSDLSKSVALESRASRVGQVDTSVGTILGTESWAEVAGLKDLERLQLGVPELDSVLDGGLQRGGLGVLLAESGGGKCHAAGQGILMFDGAIKKVEDVVSGDRLMGPDGGARNVLRTNTGHGEMFEIRPINGPSWRVNIEHILTLVGNGRYEGEIVDVSVREWLGWHQTKKRSFKLFKPGSIARFGFGEQKPLPIEPYFLGVLLGDGAFKYDSVRVTTEDSEIVQELRRQANKFNLTLWINSPGKTAPSYGFSGTMGKANPIMDRLEMLGLRGHGSGDKFIPHRYKVGSRMQRRELLAGLLDTDGHLHRAGYDFISKSAQLAADVAFIARSLGLTARLRTCTKRCQTGAVGTYHRVSIFGNGAHKIPCRLPRKQAPRRTQIKDARRSGFTIVATGKAEPFYGFTLDGDSRYLLDDFTVTHNSIGLNHIAAVNLMNGLFVGYATLELPRAVVLARTKANMTGIPINALLQGDLVQARKILDKMSSRMGTFMVQDFTPYATTVEDIKDWVRRCEDYFDDRPMDLLIVDYGDKLGAKKGKDDESGYSQGRVVFEGLRIYAADRKMFCWTASQATRQKDKRKRLDINDAADSMHKIRVADLVITINPKEEGDLLSLLLFVAKHRTGRSRVEVGPFPAAYDVGQLVAI